MGQTLRNTGVDREFKILDEATYIAVCTAVVGIGMQETHYGEKEQLKVRFEVPSERIEWTDGDGVTSEGPMIVWKTYTASLNEKANLRRDLESWRGKRFTEEELEGWDIGAIVGKACSITIVHRVDGMNTYANVATVTGVPKGMVAPKAEGDLLDFDFYNYTPEQLDTLPEWLQKRIEKGEELSKAQEQRVTPTEPEPIPRTNVREAKTEPDTDFIEDDIPF